MAMAARSGTNIAAAAPPSTRPVIALCVLVFGVPIRAAAPADGAPRDPGQLLGLDRTPLWTLDRRLVGAAAWLGIAA
jgi:hypothetical protein